MSQLEMKSASADDEFLWPEPFEKNQMKKTITFFGWVFFKQELVDFYINPYISI